jgi:RHS repeat-associated protein
LAPSDFYALYSGFTALGQAANVVYGNGAVTVHDYYPLSKRLSSIYTTGTDGDVQHLSYEYDKVGNITWIKDHINCGQSQHMEYDDLNRLKLWQRMCEGGQEQERIDLTYFKDGNIRLNSRVDPQNEYVYHPGHPHATTGTTAAPARYDYDDNGNMTQRNGATLIYDTENRVTRISQGGTDATFIYDHAGNRVKKTVGASTTLYLGNLYECANGSCVKHILAGGQRIAWKDATGLYYTHGDHLGGLNKATRGTDGSVSETDRYYPFGEVSSHSGTTDFPYKFTGKPLDPESGLYYYGARYYDPFIGRFISADSIVQAPGDPQTLNRYSYCRNNPFIYTDPTGHLFWVAALVGVMMLGAGAGAGIAAITGGDVGMGALTGAIAAGAFFGAGQGIAALGLVTQAGAYTSTGAFMAGTGIHAATGAAVGAVNSAITGGDVGMGALTGGMSGGMGHFLGGQIPHMSNPVADFSLHLGARSLIGGVSGGIAAELYGGSFGQGFGQGAWTAGFGYTFNCAFPLVYFAIENLVHLAGALTVAFIIGHYMNEGDDQSSTESAPTDKPSGTIPIDKSKGKLGLNKDEVHQVKAGVGAGSRDWVGIAPNGDVITTGADGNSINNGPFADYIMGGKRR